MSAVFAYSKSRLAARLVLLAVADHADDDGNNAWPSIPTLARKALVSERQAQRAIRTLQKMGELGVNLFAGPHGANTYTVLLRGDKLSPLGVTNRTVRGDKSGRAIRKNHPRTIQTIIPCSPLFQRGLTRRDVRSIAKQVNLFFTKIIGPDGLRKPPYAGKTYEQLDDLANQYVAEALLIPFTQVKEIRQSWSEINDTATVSTQVTA
jgi:Helix-turn-helix domain